VDDASTDRSFELLANLVETDPRLKVIRLRRNFGQTAALSAASTKLKARLSSRWTATCNTIRADIPALLAKIDEGYDIASGWRKDRVDRAVTARSPPASPIG